MTPKSEPTLTAEMEAALWERTSWEGNRRWQAERALEATPLERLRWLESALALAHAAGAVPRREPDAAPAATSSASPATRRAG